jgi:hypothetical protein
MEDMVAHQLIYRQEEKKKRLSFGRGVGPDKKALWRCNARVRGVAI